VGKGIGGVVLIEGVILIVTASWVEIYCGTRFLLNQSKAIVWIAFLVLAVPNYYFLVSRGYGIKFEREFSNLEKSRKRRLIANCCAFLLVLLGSTIYSIYTYQHFFHIEAKHY